MHRPLFSRGSALALLAAALGSAACTPQYIPEDRTDRRERELRFEQQVGGTHHAASVDGGRWFQTYGNHLLVIDVTNGRELGRAEGVPFGEGGALSDLAVEGDRAWAVSSATALVEFDVSANASPRVSERWTAAKLGIEPELVSRVKGETYVSGAGGAVRLSDGKRFLTGMAPVHVVHGPGGPVTCVGRRILALEDGRYLGAATALDELPAGIGPLGGYAFCLQGKTGATVGLMGPDFAEVSRATVPALVRRVRVCGDRFFAITDRHLHAWRIEGNAMVEPEEIPLRGGRDVALLRPNHYAVAGSFGRAMYRHREEERRDGDTFYNVDRQPGLLEVAISDGRRILAGGREGFWRWRIGGEAQLTDQTTDLTNVPDPDLSAAWGRVRLVTEKDADGVQRGVAVEVTQGKSVERYVPDGSPRITAIELVDGDVWVGHQRGIDVLRRVVAVPAPGAAAEGSATATDDGAPAPAGAPKAPAGLKVLHQWRFEGPVLFIYPERLGGGAAVVSLHGGFALVKPVAVGEAPKFKGRGEVD